MKLSHLAVVSLSVIIVTVVFLRYGSQYVPIPGSLTQILITDKEEYRMGDIIHAKLVFVNTGVWAVSFTPPSGVGWLEWSYRNVISTGVSEFIHVNWVSRSFVVSPSEEFTVLTRDLRAPYTDVENWLGISFGEAYKEVKVQP